MTALNRVALACGAALIMATAALGALRTAVEREHAAVPAASARPARAGPLPAGSSPAASTPSPKVTQPEMPSGSELDLDLGDLSGGIRATR